MRVSTSQIYNIANISMKQAQNAVLKTQEQISTNKRILTPADDPVAATTILQLNQELGRIEQYGKNINIAENNLHLEEAALDSVVNLIQRMQELAVSAGNTAVMTSVDYQSLATEVESRMEELLNLQNTRNASGQYIFAGYQGGTVPFSDDGSGTFSYHGDQGQLRLQASATVTVAVSDSGRRLFVDVPSGHNTFNTEANPANRASPPASISVGQVIDQDVYDKLFPENLVVTFNDHDTVVPSGANFTVTERNSGKVLLANQPHVAGQAIEVAGIRFNIDGMPNPTEPASLPFNFGAPVDFSANPASLTVSVGGKTQILNLNTPVTSATDLAAALSAGSNADKLVALGLTVTAAGIVSTNGDNITLSNGNADLNAVTGLDTVAGGVTSTNGVPGDKFFINSTNKQGLLTTLARFSDAMRNVQDSPESKAELSEIINKTLTNLSNSVTQISEVQGEVGARLNTLESAKDLNLDTELFSKKVLSELQDVDIAEASTRLAMETLVLNAAQQSFVKVSQLTLFTYL
jgi:flagellar hook-associated protein 3 FlgL